MMLLLLH